MRMTSRHGWCLKLNEGPAIVPRHHRHRCGVNGTVAVCCTLSTPGSWLSCCVLPGADACSSYVCRGACQGLAWLLLWARGL